MSKRPPPKDPSESLERIRNYLEILNLPHMQKELEEYLAWATRESPGPSAFLERVLGEEASIRRERRIERRISTSGLKERKTLEAFDFLFQPKLDKSVVLELARLDFVRRA